MNEFEKLQASLKEIAGGVTAVLEKSSETEKKITALEVTNKTLEAKVKSQDELHEQRIKELRDELKSRPTVSAEPKKIHKFTVSELAFYATHGEEFFKERFGDSEKYKALTSTMKQAAERRKLMYAQASSLLGIEKAQDLFSETGAGFAVPFEVLQGEFIELLRAEMVTARLGARTITGLNGASVGINKQTLGATAQWLELGEKMTIGTFKLGQLNAIPHRLGAAIELENNTQQLSSPDLQALGTEDLVQQLSLALDKAGLKGLAALKEPMGILSNGNTAATVGDLQAAALAGYNALLGMKKTLMKNNAYRGRLGWATSPEVYIELAKMKDADNRPIFPFDAPVSVNGAVFNDKVFGAPVLTTTQLNGSTGTAELIYGNWAELLYLMWGGLMISTSKEANDGFLKNTFVVKAELLADVKMRHNESFVFAKDIVVT
jgi:HK97 family phage major capsid protein